MMWRGRWLPLLNVLLSLTQVPAELCRHGEALNNQLDDVSILLQHLRFGGANATKILKRKHGAILRRDVNEASGNTTAEHVAEQMARQIMVELDNSTRELFKSPRAGSGLGIKRVNQTMIDPGQREVVSREQTIFVTADYEANSSNRGIEVQVDIELAAASQILWVFVLLWVPLLVAWLFWFYQERHKGNQSLLYQPLLQFSVGALTISSVIGNQSLSILTRAPMALTFFQSLMSVVVGVVLWACQVWNAPGAQPPAEQIWFGLLRWLPCATGFACYQVTDHFVSNTASISERVIFGNLVPVLAWSAESTFPHIFKTDREASLSAKAALFTTVCGATFFVIEDPLLAPLGVGACCFSGIVLVAYRLVQRGTLVKTVDIPVACLLAFDSLVSCTIARLLFGSADSAALKDWKLWCETPQVLLLLLLSGIGTGFGHFAVILCLQNCSATLTMVVCNIASMMCLVQGAMLFNEEESQHLMSIVGMFVNLTGGIWYATSQVGASEHVCDKGGHQEHLSTGKHGAEESAQ